MHRTNPRVPGSLLGAGGCTGAKKTDAAATLTGFVVYQEGGLLSAGMDATGHAAAVPPLT